MNTHNPSLSNATEYSVTEISQGIKKSLEDSFGYVRVRGELSRITIAKSGHMYSDLKDDQSVLNAIAWRGSIGNFKIQPEEGLEVICTGRITSYPARSNYQIIIEQMELAGEGALLKMLEERRKRLQAEGLFDQEHKKSLPFLPQKIGVVTSPTGAVIRDILHRLSDRFMRDVLVWGANVQGEKAVSDVVRGIQGFNALEESMRPDVIIVARGGGSLEDLMPFNDEAVVRAIAASNIPVISAVGHETDTTLCDYVADLRAPTPTAAAEMVVPVRSELLQNTQDQQRRLSQALVHNLRHAKNELKTLAVSLRSPQRLMEPLQQKIDISMERLDRTLISLTQGRTHQLSLLGSRLKHPQQILKEAGQSLRFLADQLSFNKIQKQLVLKKERLSHLSTLLRSLSYENVLERGFTYVTDGNKQAISRAESVDLDKDVQIHFIDGVIEASPKSLKKNNS